MPAKSLYLISSSANREYVIDCLNTLASPRGVVHHFRYRKRYLSPQLAALLSRTPGRLHRDLVGMHTVVVFVTQKYGPEGDYEPENNYLPLRCGRLIDAFTDGMVAHFYFVAEGYVPCPRGHSSSKQLESIPFKRDFAVIASRVIADRSSTGDSTAFQSFVEAGYQADEWRTFSHGEHPLDISYDILFYRVVGLFHETLGPSSPRLTPVTPILHAVPGAPYVEYPLKLGESYRIRLATYHQKQGPAQLPGQGSAHLELEFDSNIIHCPGPANLRVASPYDLENFMIIPRSASPARSTLRITLKGSVPISHGGYARKEIIAGDALLPIIVVPPSSRQ